MNIVITQEELIRYAYGEVDDAESYCIEQQLLCDSSLKEQYEEIVATQEILDLFPVSNPSDTSVRLIMDYSGEGKGQAEQLEALF